MFIAIVMSVGRSDAEHQGRDLPRALVGCWDTEPCPNFRRSLLCPLGTVQSLRCTDCGEIPTLDNIRVEELEGWTGTSPTVTTRLLWSSYADAIAQGDHTRTADILALVELYAERGEGVVRAVLIPAGEVLLPRVIQLVLRGTPVVFIVYEPANCVPVRVVVRGELSSSLDGRAQSILPPPSYRWAALAASPSSHMGILACAFA